MPQAESNGLTLEYEEFGDSADPPILLVMGLSAQMTVWPEDFCRQLAHRGHRVIRFDNRDVGLSTWFDQCPVWVIRSRPSSRSWAAGPSNRLTPWPIWPMMPPVWWTPSASILCMWWAPRSEG